LILFLVGVVISVVLGCYNNEIAQLAPIQKKAVIGLVVSACIVTGLIYYFHETLLSSIGNVISFFSANPEVWLLILVVSLIILVVYGVIKFFKFTTA
jgi:hypothetical protein